MDILLLLYPPWCDTGGPNKHYFFTPSDTMLFVTTKYFMQAM